MSLPGGKTTRTPPRNTESETSSRSATSSSSSMAFRQSSSHGPGPGLKRGREEEVRPLAVPVTPAVEPVEQRWEESEGKYMHKKFKKMASSAVEDAKEPSQQTLQQTPPPSAPVFNHFPLKHSALSLVQPASGSEQQQHRSDAAVISSSFRPTPTFQTSPPTVVESPPSSSSTLLTSTASTEEDLDSPARKRNVCPFCQMVCAKPSVLDKHIRTHTNERPYPCEPCGFAFKTKSNLYKHCKSRTHSLKVEKGIDSSSADIMAELGDTLREEIDGSHVPVSPPSVSAVPPLTVSNGQVRFIDPARVSSHQHLHQQQHPAGEFHYRPVTLQPLPASTTAPTTYILPGLYKPGPEVRHSFAPGQPQQLTFPSQPSPRRDFVVIAQASSQDVQASSSQPPLVNYATLRLPQAQPILVRPQNLPGVVRIDDKNLVLPQRPVNLVQEERPRLPVAPLQLTSATSAASASTNQPTDLSVVKKVGPDFLQQRIDKVISENQAIVETLDPLWPRRYMRQSSKDQSTSEDKGHRTGNRKYSLPSAASTTTASVASSTTATPLYTSAPLAFVAQQPQVPQHRPPVRLPEPLVTFPKQPVPVLSTAPVSASVVPVRTFATSFPDKPVAGLEPVYVMSSNPLDLATANRKRTLSLTPVMPPSQDSGLAGKFTCPTSDCFSSESTLT